MTTPLTPKERLKIPRQKMPEQAAEQRSHNFQEVNLGLEMEVAKREASRCLECSSAACVSGCPVGVKVKEFVALVLSGDILGAAEEDPGG